VCILGLNLSYEAHGSRVTGGALTGNVVGGTAHEVRVIPKHT